MAFATEEERLAARRMAWNKYNLQHREERRAHNKLYSKRPEVKARRREAYARKVASRQMQGESVPTIQHRDAISESDIVVNSSLG